MGKGKGKKKGRNKGKRRGGKKTREDTDDEGDSSTLQLTPEHYERARLAAANRTEDPLKNWTRPMQEECPICMLPLPLSESETNYCFTCGKTVCMGCMISIGVAHKRGGGDMEKAFEMAATCPYCRSNAVYDDKFRLEKEMKRANAGNHDAMLHLGMHYFNGERGILQDKAEGLKWFHRALEAESGNAAYLLGECYLHGDGVDKDHDKAFEYYQKAAELEFVPAFSLIGAILMKRGDIEEAMLNFRKATMCGDSDVFNLLRNGFKDGLITKDEYAYTLRENQAACNEMKSDAREEWLAT